MAPVVVFPDVVELLVTYVRAELIARGVTARVGARVPRTGVPAAGFVLIRRLGGPRENIVVDAPQVGVEVWRETEHEAADLAQLVRALLFALRGGLLGTTPVYRVDEFAGPGALPDPTTDYPRYVFTHLVRVRGTEEP